MTFKPHELLSEFDGVRYLVLGTQDESEYCRDMDEVVSAMAGMDVAGVMEFEQWSVQVIRTTDVCEKAALAWLAVHGRDLDFDGAEICNAPAFIKEHCRDELAEMACKILAEREGQREIASDYRASAL